MIIKFGDSYLRTDLTLDSAKFNIETALGEHILEYYDLNLEHFLEQLVESDNFDILSDEQDFDFEYTQDMIDDMIYDILEDNDKSYNDNDFESFDEDFDNEESEDEN